MTDAVVVGGGIAGTATAYHLQTAGIETVLVDRADAGRATRAGAGIISPPTSSRTDIDPWYAFASDAVAYFPTLNDALTTAGVAETSYRRQGMLSIAVDDAGVTGFEATIDRIEARAVDGIEEIDPDEAVARCPAIERPVRALYHADAARLEGTTYADALVTAARRAGLEVRSGDVSSLHWDGDRITGVELAAGDSIAAADVVIAGGAWSSAFEADLPIDVPVTPLRGQIAHLEHDAETADWPIVSGVGHYYIVPWPDGRLVCGATREEAGHDPRVTVDGLRAVLAGTTTMAPGLADATVAELRVGLRPASPDGLPILGPVADVDGVHLATGFGPTGLTLGPYSGKLIADGIVAGASAVPAAVDCNRFG